MTASSSVNSEHTAYFGDVFAVFDPVRENSKSECLRSCDRFLTARSVRENPREIDNLADPTTIVLELDFHREVAHVREGYNFGAGRDLPWSSVLPLSRGDGTRKLGFTR